MPSENNRRLAKNTLLLYFRMLLAMFVSLFTVRVVFNTLGTVDYGIYNVVGGVVAMFSFLSGTMAAASQRFFAFELGRKDFIKLKKIFSMTIMIYAIVAIVVVLLGETIGLWFLNNKMVIPVNRVTAANWIYQFSILSFLVTIMTIPYDAVIIAHENMKVYAYVSIIEVTLKLLIVYILVCFSFDKLKLYSLLIFMTSCIVTFIYRSVCKRKYKECKFSFKWDKSLFKMLIGYSGWNLFGALAGILNNHGINILLNIFFGPVINAARSIAFQVSSSVNQFVMNFLMAVNPQITKYYATDDKNKMMELVVRTSKLSFFLLFLISMPMLLETHFILALWLKKVPDSVVIFTILIIVSALVDSLSYPLMTAAQATGQIRLYQLVVGGALLLNLPISYCFLKAGFPPQVTMYIVIVISIICFFLRVLILKKMIGMPVLSYYKRVLFQIILVTSLAYIIPFVLVLQLPASGGRFFAVGIAGLITSVISIYSFGLSVNERQYFIQTLKNKAKL